MKENGVLKSSRVQSRIWPSVWWDLLTVRQCGNQGLDPSHLYSCEQSLLAPVIPLTLLGARISPASAAWQPASCLAPGALMELPVLCLMFLPKLSCSSRAFLTLTGKPGSLELFLAITPLGLPSTWDGQITESFRLGKTFKVIESSRSRMYAFLSGAILLQWREGWLRFVTKNCWEIAFGLQC